MKVIATILIIFVIGVEYSLAANKNSTSIAAKNNSTSIAANNNSTSLAANKNSTGLPANNNSNNAVLVSPGITVSKGFQKANCLASKFGVLCASSTIDGCVTKNSKTKCGKQCICGTSDCSCGTSGCYCQVNAACRCNQ